MVSAVVAKFRGVSRSSRPPARAASQLCGSRYGSTSPCAAAWRKRAADRGVGGHPPAVGLVALHHAEGQAEGEGGVGVGQGPRVLEQGPGDEGVLRRWTPSTWSSKTLRTARASSSTARASRIIGSVEAATAARPPGPAPCGPRRRPGESRAPARGPPLRACCRRGRGRGWGPSRPSCPPEGQRAGEPGLLVLGVDRGRRVEGLLKRGAGGAPYPRSRSASGFVSSSTSRTMVRAMPNNSESKAAPRSRNIMGRSCRRATSSEPEIRSQAGP